MAVDHYENFPVASLLLPARLRPAVQAIYAFARSADDLADEGDALPAERLAALERYEAALRQIAAPGDGPSVDGPSVDGPPVDAPPLFDDLRQVFHAWQLPLQPFEDLLSAFKQDVTTARYPDYAALLDYCSRSADPVGNLMLHLYQAATPANLSAANAICSALQLINFLQDVAIDRDKGRIYLPQEDLIHFGVSERDILHGDGGANWHALMAFEVQRTRSLMYAGAPLALRLPGRIGWELRMVVQGGLRILARIEAADFDVFRQRPVLRWRDWLAIAHGALRMKAATPMA